mgnify:CR=1 FL=1
MKLKPIDISQLFLRLAISFSFLSAVVDRFGLWGAAGSSGVSWGNWQNFVNYANTLNFYLSPKSGEVAAIIATVLEVIFGLLLLIGFKTKQTAIASGIMLAVFATAMSISIGFKAPFDYSVWTGAAASFLLSTIKDYRYSIDNRLKANT